MSNLNKIKEEGEEEFNEWFDFDICQSIENQELNTTFGILLSRNMGSRKNNIPAEPAELLDWHNKQIDKAYSLAIDEVVEEINLELNKICEDCENERVNGEGVCYGYTEKGNQVLNSLKQKLLSLKNKNNG